MAPNLRPAGPTGAARRRAGRLAAVVLLLALGGCAVQPPPVEHYRCEQGRSFSLSPGSDASGAVIDIRGMRFLLTADAADASGERLSCSVLSLWRRDGRARVELQGERAYEGCRRMP